jgi:transcriptional regulator with XRE-family HTH domain
MASPSQIRAARALLNWTTEDLAAATGLNTDGLRKIERGTTRPHKSTADKIQAAFLDQGVIFTDDDGIRRQRSGIKVYEGREGFKAWLDDVYETVKNGGDICISGCRESEYVKWLSPEDDHRHTERMKQIAGLFTCRAILAEGDYNFYSSEYATFKWISKEKWDLNPLYLYGPKLAVIEFSGEEPRVNVIISAATARSFKKIFEAMWETCKDIPPLRKNL